MKHWTCCVKSSKKTSEGEMKKIIVSMKDSKDFVQFSDEFEISKNHYISVAPNCIAVAYNAGKPIFRTNACDEKNLVSTYGKECLNQKIQFAFVKMNSVIDMPWGFGNIQVNNERLQEAYRVGANGHYSIKIDDYVKLVSSFSMSQNIDCDKIREKTISVIKTIGIPILSSYFANSGVSVFEISSLVSEIREKMLKELLEEKVFERYGLKLVELTVDGIHVNEDDLELIRERIND